MPYLTAFVPESAQPAAEAATPAACYARCTAAGCLMQELAALLYKEGNVPFDQILFPYADALLLSQHKPAYAPGFRSRWQTDCRRSWRSVFAPSCPSAGRSRRPGRKDRFGPACWKGRRRDILYI